jgi:protein subunit release factor B|tara:strand:+ start:127 stop:438 length:312 start_codon:yes stop_codon:yes gene_type:complete
MTNDFAIFDNNVVEMHQEDSQLSEKQEKMLEYIRQLADIEAQMEPLKEDKRELKAEFKNSGWLTGDEISMTVKVYRMIKSDSFDINEFMQVYDSLATSVGKNQ